jgi:hypothetical protein
VRGCLGGGRGWRKLRGRCRGRRGWDGGGRGLGSGGEGTMGRGQGETPGGCVVGVGRSRLLRKSVMVAC